MRRLTAAFLGLVASAGLALAEEGFAPAATPDAAALLDGMWQLTDVMSSDGNAAAAQTGRLLQLGRQSVTGFDGTSCANPTLAQLSQLRMRGIDPLLMRLEQVEDAYRNGIAAICLGSLFAVYVPQADGALIAADRVALYRLQPLAGAASGSGQ